MTESKSSLLDATLTLLCRSELPLETIAHKIGVRYDWLVRVKSGRTPNPGVIRVQALYEFLSKTTLKVIDPHA